MWDDTAIAKLRTMWKTHSCTQIAAELGVSRNAVIGKGYRIGLGAKVDPRPTQPKERAIKAPPVGSIAFKVIDGIKRQQKRQEQPAIKPQRIECRDARDIEPLRLSLLDVEDGCRWPYGGETEKITFCGHPQTSGSSYCLGHARLSVGSGSVSERRAHHVSTRVA